MATSTIIALLLQGNCTDAQIDSFLQRMTDAQQKGHDAFGLTTDQLQAMLQLIIQKLKDSDTDIQLEGQIAQIVTATITGVEIPQSAGTVNTKYDLVTTHALIEVSNGSGGRKTKQLKKYLSTDVANYTPPKPIVFYIPKMPAPAAIEAARTMLQTEQSMGKNVPVYIVTQSGVWFIDEQGVQQLEDARKALHHPWSG